MAVRAEFGVVRAAPFEQRRAERRTALAVAQGVHLEAHLKTECAAEFVDHDDQFGVAGGVGAAENLNSELVELA